MSRQMRGAWQPATAANLAHAPVTTGVYELRDAAGETVDLGYAGARETFGLRSALQRALGPDPDGSLEFRCELHVVYMTRYIELVLEYQSRHNGLPPTRVSTRPAHVTGRIQPQ